MNQENLSVQEFLELKKSKKLSLEDFFEELFKKIKKIDAKIKSYVRLNEDGLSEANLNGGPLCGVPIAIKDNICIKDRLTTCCSKILEGFRPPYDATVIEKIKKSGAVIIGTTNMDEFAFGSSTENSCYGPTRNPWDEKRVVGGSSGGSAAAVASGQAILALGSDTGGSIRQPASFCGVVGLKPTYGRVSRYGLVAFASSLDQIGPIVRNVSDAAMLLGVIAGYDEKDSTSVNAEVPDYFKALDKNVKGLRIGVPKEYFVEGIDPQVKKAVEEAIKQLKGLGVVFKDVSLPHTEYAIATYYIVATAEASSNLARFDGVQYGMRVKSPEAKTSALIEMYKQTRGEGFGQEAKRRIILGTYALSSGYYEAYYLRAQKVRALIKKDFDEAFKECDCIITPTSPTTAFKIGERVEDLLAMYLSDIFTISANLSGIPAISIPCGFNKENLPIGLQILAKPFDEEAIFKVAYAYEQSNDWHKRCPE